MSNALTQPSPAATSAPAPETVRTGSMKPDGSKDIQGASDTQRLDFGASMGLGKLVGSSPFNPLKSKFPGQGWWLGAGATLAVLLVAVLILLLVQASRQGARVSAFYTPLFFINLALAALLALAVLVLGWRLWRGVRNEEFGARLLLKLALIFSLVGLLPSAMVYTVAYQFVNRTIASWFDNSSDNALSAALDLTRQMLETQSRLWGQNTQEHGQRWLARALKQTDTSNFKPDFDQLAGREWLDKNQVLEISLWTDQGEAVYVFKPQRLARALPENLSEKSPDLSTGFEPSDKLQDIELRALSKSAVVTQITDLDPEELNAPTQKLPKLLAWVRVSGAASTHPSNKTSGALQPDTETRQEALTPTTQKKPKSRSYILRASRTLLPNTAAQIQLVQTHYLDKQEQQLARAGLQRMFTLALTFCLLLASLGALVMAFWLGRRLTQPVLLLAQGMQEVAQGNLEPKPTALANDELSGLTRAFAAMNDQVNQAQRQAGKSLALAERFGQELQQTIDQLSSAVVVVDTTLQVLRINQAGTQRFFIGSKNTNKINNANDANASTMPIVDMTSYNLSKSLFWQDNDGLEKIRAALESSGLGRSNNGVSAPQDELEWEFTLDAVKSLHDGSARSFRVRGRPMGKGEHLLMVDDITDLQTTQRLQAWTEVAKRVAHEIKNPLTPIQLAAERLELKLADKLQGSDQMLLQKSVKTIADQVQAMKRLVNEFRDYARLPKAQLTELDLNQLLLDLKPMYPNSSAMAARGVGVAYDLLEELPTIFADAQQLRQVVHNLLQNAQEANQQVCATDHEPRQVWVQTYVKPHADGSLRVRLQVSDQGAGFSPEFLTRAFEPYVTTKVKGTGLGLAMVKKILDEHQASIKLSNREAEGMVLGARVAIEFKPSA